MKKYQFNKQTIARLIFAGLIVFGLIIFSLIASPVAATPASGLTAEPVASGVLTDAIRLKFKGNGGFADGTDVQEIRVVKYTLVPGGTFGWHQHGGPVWAVVVSGTFTIYDGDDKTCTPQVFTAGSAFLDEGDHTHIGINESTAPVEIYAIFMLPKDGSPRLDAADPKICN